MIFVMLIWAILRIDSGKSNQEAVLMKSKRILIAILLLTSSACSTNRSSEIVETKTENPDGSQTTVTTHNKIEEESNSSSCSGVASCTVDFLGDVIAFPFRLVGGLVQAIF